VLERLFNLAWYGRVQWTWVLWPLTMLVGLITSRKREAYLAANMQHYAVPVIVVGNITVGGTGKTPVVQSMVKYLQDLGYRPGIISRGYGGTLGAFPHLIQDQDPSSMVGDEPYMLFQSLNIPVVVDPVRTRAVSFILESGVDVIISDDGLQHYQLHRDYEVCVIDGLRNLGNGQLMPVGPLREHKARLETVDYVLKQQSGLSETAFQIEPVAWVNVLTGKHQQLSEFDVKPDAVAIAGIGNPDKFKRTLEELGIHCAHKWFPDHHGYTQAELSVLPSQVLMTEKDAVKIKPFAGNDMWYLKISARLPDAFLQNLKLKLEQWKQDHG
jgi:tetraacyldisaccharide 4'-kinase